MHFCQISPQNIFFLIISLTIECADHIRSSSLSPVNHRSQKTLSFSLGKSLPKSSNQDRGGLPPIRNEQGRPWCTCCWPVACPPTVEHVHVHILLQSGPSPPKKITQITYPTFNLAFVSMRLYMDAPFVHNIGLLHIALLITWGEIEVPESTAKMYKR